MKERGNARSTGLALAASLVVAGCVLGPDHRVPVLPRAATSAFVSVSPTVDPAREAPDAWWRLYDDEVLAGLVAEALTANSDLRVAVANLALSRALLREARAGRFPTTQSSAGVVYGRSPIANSVAAAFRGHADEQTTYLGGFDVSYELDLYGRVARSIEAADADAQAVEAARDVVRVAVAAETTRAYATARNVGRELKVAQRSVEIADEATAIVTRQMAAGAASSFDLARVRVVADQARAAIPAFEGRRRAALFELAALLGRFPSEVPIDEANGGMAMGADMVLPVGDGTRLLARRPDVRQAERRLASATARIGVASASLHPRVSLGANLGLASNEVLKGSNVFSFAVGPLVSWSFPNQEVARSRIEQSDAAAAAALATFDGTVLRALKEVEQSISACEAESSRRVALSSAEENAAEAYRLSRLRLSGGALSQLDLLAAEQTLLGARAALAGADSRIIDAQITLFKALGGGWRERSPSE